MAALLSASAKGNLFLHLAPHHFIPSVLKSLQVGKITHVTRILIEITYDSWNNIRCIYHTYICILVIGRERQRCPSQDKSKGVKRIFSGRSMKLQISYIYCLVDLK